MLFTEIVMTVDEETVDDTVNSTSGESWDRSVNVTEGYDGLKMYVGRKVRGPVVTFDHLFCSLPSKRGIPRFTSSTFSTSGRGHPILRNAGNLSKISISPRGSWGNYGRVWPRVPLASPRRHTRHHRSCRRLHGQQFPHRQSLLRYLSLLGQSLRSKTSLSPRPLEGPVVVKWEHPLGWFGRFNSRFSA
jgi:hypothetical protein